MSLTAYQKKRNFEQTPEPLGKTRTKAKQLRFVVQKHHASHLHYDFRLEMDGVLKSWAVPKGPSMDPDDKHLAVMVEDHPFAYRKFHGVIPKGNYGAGTVEIWDEGTYVPVMKSVNNEKELLAELANGDIKIVLNGKKLKGSFALVRMKNDEKNWLIIKEKDKYITTDNILSEKIPAATLRKILLSGRKTAMPHEIKPMLAKLADRPFNDPDWVYELKWDGYRAIAEINKGAIKLYSRNNQQFDKLFPEVIHSLEDISNDVILDGEIVAYDKDGNANFQLIQDYRRKKEGITLLYHVFDLLFVDGHDIRNLPLTERKTILKTILPHSPHLRFSDHIEKYGLQLFELAKKEHAEGIMAKQKNSVYVSERNADWLKIKNILTQEAVICGFTKPNGSRMHFGALILGVYENNELRYVGHTGTGFDEARLSDLQSKLEPLTTTKCPFPAVPKTNAPATWVKPRLIAQIKFSEWTRDGLMRQPVFLGLREDKQAEDVQFEAVKTKAEKQKQTFSNLTKIFWPREGYTKGDLIAYYDRIAPFILPYLKDRPESLLRHPDGITGENFYQKEMSIAPDWVKRVTVHSDSENKDINWLICNDKDTLLYMANLGCIEINPWSCRITKQDYPDYLILDLDPEGISFAEVITTATCVKEILDTAKIDAYLKTSGKTGMHILVPLGANYTYDETRQFAELLARIVVKRLPDTTSILRNPEKRDKKVYIDFLQNRFGQTITAPYSVRPVPHAAVSTPLSWEELTPRLNPSDFTIKTVFRRLTRNGDLWDRFLKHKGISMLKSLSVLTKLNEL